MIACFKPEVIVFQQLISGYNVLSNILFAKPIYLGEGLWPRGSAPAGVLFFFNQKKYQVFAELGLIWELRASNRLREVAVPPQSIPECP